MARVRKIRNVTAMENYIPWILNLNRSTRARHENEAAILPIASSAGSFAFSPGETTFRKRNVEPS